MKDFLLKDNSDSPLLEVYEQLWFDATWLDELQWLQGIFHRWSKVSEAFCPSFARMKGLETKTELI